MMATGSAGRSIDGPEAFQSVFGVSRETTQKFETYTALLKQWQKAVQLVAPSTLDVIWSRHFADSAQLAALAPPGVRTWLDFGSGAGFPGLVIAILAQDRASAFPDVGVTLVESDTRKAAFMREVARQLGVAVDILGTRIESPATRDKVGAVEVISARALAPLSDLLQLAHPFWQPATIGLFLKGREVDKEIEAARFAWAFELELKPSLTDPAARIACVRHLSAGSPGARTEGKPRDRT
jgi:16S rRNA (guanine527-N7)-methyltransferase